MRIALVLALSLLFFHESHSRTVQDVINSGECSTYGFKKLSMQAVEAFKLVAPNSVARADNIPNLDLADAVIPYLQTSAVTALKNAASKGRIQINSLIRAFPQQLALYAWYKAGRCGIPLAASPGSSPHESGLGIDVGNYGSVQSAMKNAGFSWQGSGDPVHFTYVGSGRKDLEGKDILAFQKLWNCNNPNDKIAEDGQFGEGTKSRALKSPAEGFPSTCGGGSGGGTPQTGGQDSADVKITGVPSVAKLNTMFFITGKTYNGVVTVKLKVDDYTITSIPVKNGIFSFELKLNTGGNRKIVVEGFTSDSKFKSLAYKYIQAQ